MNTTISEVRTSRPSDDFKCGLACENVGRASELIGAGQAALRISVYPWGAEFDVVRKGTVDESAEENPDVVG